MADQDRQAFAALGQANGTVGLDGCVRRALEEIVALDHHIGVVHGGLDIPELQLDDLGDVAVVAGLAGLVNVGALGRADGLVRVHDGGQGLVAYFDELKRLQSHALVHRRHGGYAVADVPNAVHTEGILVRRPGDDPVGGGHVPARHHGMHALEGAGS